MKYKLIERENPQDRSQKKWYAQPVNEGRIGQKEIATDIMDLSSLSRGDVSNVIESLIATVPRYLLMGKSVNLGNLGTLRLSFSSEGTTDPKAFNTGMISGVKVIFTPSVEFKEKLTKISFEKAE
ncbi:HU family DNA-binding protein [Petrimonas sulfuriphila]|jgi:predicted histone-like DNA-binding protein|uniref:HU family DNA-binding protein n=1 Tax=Petrimonas sulfuriphila TaxID=285070 RepID=UPI003253E4A3